MVLVVLDDSHHVHVTQLIKLDGRRCLEMNN